VFSVVSFLRLLSFPFGIFLVAFRTQADPSVHALVSSRSSSQRRLNHMQTGGKSVGKKI
jgi:hypothetical protein